MLFETAVCKCVCANVCVCVWKEIVSPVISLSSATRAARGMARSVAMIALMNCNPLCELEGRARR